MIDDSSLLKFIPSLSPEMYAPIHLTDWCDQFERIRRGDVGIRALCDVPIRHYKSETSIHGAIYILRHIKDFRWLILTHSHQRAIWLGKRVRGLAELAGVGPARGYNLIEDWTNDSGGGCVVMSWEQSKIGGNVHGLLWDDPLDEHMSMTPATRDECDAQITHYTARCQRGGIPGPVLGVMSRWHPDDPIGRRLFRTAVQWTYIHHPAVIDDDLPTRHAWAPDVWPLEMLDRVREEMREVDPTEHLWFANFMGDPRPAGGSKWSDSPALYEKLPDGAFRPGFGVDLAYTVGEGSDHFAMAAGKVYGRKLYILEVSRAKLDTPIIESMAKNWLAKYGRGPIYSYVSGPELGTVSLMRERKLPFVPLRARYNKMVRAQRTIKRWNDGDIVLPQGAKWLPGLLRRNEVWTGLEKARDDDEQDAIVSLADGLLGGTVAGGVPRTMGRTYGGLTVNAQNRRTR